MQLDTPRLRGRTRQWRLDLRCRAPRRRVCLLSTELARTSYELQLLEAIRAQLSTLGDGSVVVVAGPQELMTELVAEAARAAAEDLVEIVRISGASRRGPSRA